MQVRGAKPRRAGAVVLAVVALSALVACGAPPPAPASTAQTVTVTDIVGRQVQVKAAAERIFLGEGRLLYLMAMLDREEPLRRIVGWPNDLKTADLDTYERYREQFPQIDQIPEVGALSQGAFSAERVIDLRPDVIVLSMSGYQNAQEIGAIETMEKVGIPTVVVDFRDHPLETTGPSVEILGQIMGREDRAREFVEFYDSQIEMVRSRVAGLEPKPVTFLYRAAGLLECCGTFGRSNLGELIELAGGQNLGAQFLTGESGTLAEEQVFASDPDLIVLTGSNWTNSPNKTPGVGYVSMGYQADPEQSRAQLRAITEQPGWSSLGAVRTGQVHALWHQFYGSPYNFLAAIQLAKWQHPQALADVDPTQIYRDFHERFLPVPFSGTFWVTL
jgi:iron complex transport system substrate-binding protein